MNARATGRTIVIDKRGGQMPGAAGFGILIGIAAVVLTRVMPANLGLAVFFGCVSIQLGVATGQDGKDQRGRRTWKIANTSGAASYEMP